MTTVRRYLLPTLVGALLVVGLLGWWMSYDLGSNEAADNSALIDAKATATVQSQVTQTLTKVLSYDYAEPAATEKAADRLLAGDARTEYDTLFATLQKRAPGQKLVLTAAVQVTGVKKLDGDTAELLVYLDQSSRRASDKEASVSAAQLAITAKRTGDLWKVTGLKPL